MEIRCMISRSFSETLNELVIKQCRGTLPVVLLAGRAECAFWRKLDRQVGYGYTTTHKEINSRRLAYVGTQYSSPAEDHGECRDEGELQPGNFDTSLTPALRVGPRA